MMTESVVCICGVENPPALSNRWEGTNYSLLYDRQGCLSTSLVIGNADHLQRNKLMPGAKSHNLVLNEGAQGFGARLVLPTGKEIRNGRLRPLGCTEDKLQRLRDRHFRKTVQGDIDRFVHENGGRNRLENAVDPKERCGAEDNQQIDDGSDRTTRDGREPQRDQFREVIGPANGTAGAQDATEPKPRNDCSNANGNELFKVSHQRRRILGNVVKDDVECQGRKDGNADALGSVPFCRPYEEDCVQQKG